jgi:formiminoglutamase
MVKDFFQPISNEHFHDVSSTGSIGHSILYPPEDFSEEVAIMSVGAQWLPLRRAFYSLMNHFSSLKIVDYGVFLESKDASHSLLGLVQVLEQLKENKTHVLILGTDYNGVIAQWENSGDNGGIKDLAFVIPSLESPLIEPFWDIWTNKSFHNDLFHVSFLGHQSYFNPIDKYEKMNDFFYDELRLGALRSQPHAIEPILRESSYLAFDINALKSSECDAGTMHYPNGISTEEACLISRYAGISNQIDSVGIYGLREDLSVRDSMQLAQMCWYYLEGIEAKYYDIPNENNRDFTIMRCPLEGYHVDEMVFLKSLKSGRIWMQVSFQNQKRWIGCTEEEYLIAVQGEIPEKWFRAGGVSF